MMIGRSVSTGLQGYAARSRAVIMDGMGSSRKWCLMRRIGWNAKAAGQNAAGVGGLRNDRRTTRRAGRAPGPGRSIPCTTADQ